MLEAEVLVRELHAVDGLPPGAGGVGEVAALDHEGGDDAVEDAVLVVQRLALLADALLASAQRAEVLRRLGNLKKKEKTRAGEIRAE